MADSEPAPKRGRPVTTGTTPHRTVRVPDELWEAAKEAAAAQEETLTAVIERALEQYVSDYRRSRMAKRLRKAGGTGAS